MLHAKLQLKRETARLSIPHANGAGYKMRCDPERDQARDPGRDWKIQEVPIMTECEGERRGGKDI